MIACRIADYIHLILELLQSFREDAEKQKKRREEEEAARAAIADKGEALKGRVKKWEYSYGFIEISEPKEHRKAGGIFAHISDFKNREGHT